MESGSNVILSHFQLQIPKNKTKHSLLAPQNPRTKPNTKPKTKTRIPSLNRNSLSSLTSPLTSNTPTQRPTHCWSQSDSENHRGSLLLGQVGLTGNGLGRVPRPNNRKWTRKEWRRRGTGFLGTHFRRRK